MIIKSPSSNALKQQFSKKNMINIMTDSQNNFQREKNDSKQNKKKTNSPKNNEMKINKNIQKSGNNTNENSITKDFSKSRKNLDQESQLINNDKTKNYQYQNTLLNSTNNTNFKSTTNKTANSNLFNMKSPKGNPTQINLNNKNPNNFINLNIKTNHINNPDNFLGEKKETYSDLKTSLLASMPVISLTSPKGNKKDSKSPLRKNIVKSTSKTKHPNIRVEEDNTLGNSIEENKYTKRNASERNLKSANSNMTNNNFLPGNTLMNQSVKNSTINSSNYNLNSTQHGSNVIIYYFLFFQGNIRKNDIQISTNGANLLTSNYFKDFIQSENNNINNHLKSSKIQENINYNLNFNNGHNTTTNQNSNNMNFNSVNMKLNPQDKKISQNKNIAPNIKTNGFNSLKSLDSSKGTNSTKNINGKKFIFNDKPDKIDLMKIENNTQSNNKNNDERGINANNLNRFTKIGKDPKFSTKQSEKVKNIFSSKIADNQIKILLLFEFSIIYNYLIP